MIREIGVVVPAANEENHLADCLRSLLASRDRLSCSRSHRVRVRIILVLDGCRDGSADVAAGFAGVETIGVDAGCAGAARRAGTTLQLRGGTPAGELWLANTDADSLVPANWLTGMLDEAARGAHLVLGTVTPGPGLSSEAMREWCLRHVVQEGHPHVHGANFGIRADVYSALGGWQALACGEDDALAARAASAGHLRIARTARIPVVTSTRLQARAPDGFSSYLRELVTPIDQRTHEQLRIEVA